MQYFYAKNKKRGKKAQVTIFIIVALVILFAVLMLLIFKPELKPVTKQLEPDEYFKKCISDAANEISDKISENGGSVEVRERYFLYNGKRISFLCYTNKYYTSCVNQEPLLKEHVEAEILKYIKAKADSCSQKLIADFKSKGYEIENSINNIDVSLEPKKIVVNVNAPTIIKKGESIKRFDNFKVSLTSPLYDFVILAGKIVNYEIRYGDFNLIGYILWNPAVDIDKNNLREATVYILQDRITKKTFTFAVRSYIMPPGPF